MGNPANLEKKYENAAKLKKKLFISKNVWQSAKFDEIMKKKGQSQENSRFPKKSWFYKQIFVGFGWKGGKIPLFYQLKVVLRRSNFPNFQQKIFDPGNFAEFQEVFATNSNYCLRNFIFRGKNIIEYLSDWDEK